MQGGDGDEDDDDDDHADDLNFSSGANDFASQTLDDPLSQGSFNSNTSALDGTILAGDNLLSQPKKVS